MFHYGTMNEANIRGIFNHVRFTPTWIGRRASPFRWKVADVCLRLAREYRPEVCANIVLQGEPMSAAVCGTEEKRLITKQ